MKILIYGSKIEENASMCDILIDTSNPVYSDALIEAKKLTDPLICECGKKEAYLDADIHEEDRVMLSTIWVCCPSYNSLLKNSVFSKMNN